MKKLLIVSFAMCLMAATGPSNGTVNAPSDPQFCNDPTMNAVLLPDAGIPVLVPGTSLDQRRSVTICNSNENATAGLVKCCFATEGLRDAGIVDAGPALLDAGPQLIDSGVIISTLFDGGETVYDAGPCPFLLPDAGIFDAGGYPFVDGGPYEFGGYVNLYYGDAGPSCLGDGGTSYTLDGGWPNLIPSGYWLVFDAGIVDAGPAFGDAGPVCLGSLAVPLLGAGNPGDTLKQGDCVTYPAGTGAWIECISQVPSTDVSTLECQ